MDTLADNNYHDHSRDKPNKWIVVIILIISLAGIIYSLSKPVGKDVVSGRVLNDYEPVAIGDKIFLSQSLFGDSEWSMANISRTRDLMILFAFFIILVILTSGWKGFYSLVGLLFTFAVIFIFMLPQILKGVSPVFIGISGASLILIPTLYLS